MRKSYYIKTSGHIIWASFITLVVISLSCLGCYREEELTPVIVEPNETTLLSKQKDRTFDEAQTVQSVVRPPKQKITQVTAETGKKLVPDKPKEKTVTEKDQIERGFFNIQVAAFYDLSKAKQVVKDLRTEGYQTYVCRGILQKRGQVYRVLVGNFETKEQADLLLSKLKSKFNDSFIRFYRLPSSN